MSHVVTRNYFALDPFKREVDWNRELELRSMKLKKKRTMQSVNRFSVYISDTEDDAQEKRENPIIFLDPEKEEAKIKDDKSVDDVTKSNMLDAIRDAAENDSIVCTHREELRAEDDCNAVKNTSTCHHFKIERNHIKASPPIKDKDEEAVVLHYLEHEDEYEISNLSESCNILLSQLKTEFNDPEASQQTFECKHCNESVNSNMKLLHNLSCSKNPSNMCILIQNREKPCFCTRPGLKKKLPICTHSDITGPFYRTELFRKQNTHVATLLGKIRSGRRTVSNQSNNATPTSMEQLKLCIGELLEKHGFLPHNAETFKEKSLLAKQKPDFSIEECSNIVKYLKIQVISTGKISNKPTKSDNFNAWRSHGGWSALVEEFCSSTSQQQADAQEVATVAHEAG